MTGEKRTLDMEKYKITDNDRITELKKITRKLKTAFFIIVALVVLCVAYNEIIPSTLLGIIDCGTKEYYVLMSMELITICLIPAALKMMSLKQIIENIKINGLAKYSQIAMLRMSMIGLPLLANAFLYYCFMSVAYAYMAIIGALCLVFVYPSEGRCLNETQCKE